MSKKRAAAKIDLYADLLRDVKLRIQHAQTRAVLAVNAELVRLYWDIGRELDARQAEEGYGTAVIPWLATDLRNELPEVKGFSERNIGRMVAFYRAYPNPDGFLPQAVAKPPAEAAPPPPAAKLAPGASLLWAIPWGHHAVLIEKVKNWSSPRIVDRFEPVMYLSRAW